MQVFMFPGQGSQKRGMGEALFDEITEFKNVEDQIDTLLGYSLRTLCLEDDQERLKDTRYTQPCLYVVNALHYYQMLNRGEHADVFIGHSLGEYNALLAAGAFDLLTGLRMVKRRGELMAQVHDGAMMAVVGLSAPDIVAVLQAQHIPGIDIANFNAPMQTVLSGPAEDLQRAVQPLEAAGAQMVVPLSVSAAFHSRYMFDASQAFDEFLADITFAPLQSPVIANITGRPYPASMSPSVIRQYLVKQIAHPVQWTRSMRYLLDEGAQQFKEVGPGHVLTRLSEHNRHAH